MTDEPIKTVIVKGNAFDVARAAADRGVALAHIKTLDETTIGKTNASADKLNTWFCETIDPPFPAGALLFWGFASVNPTDNDPLTRSRNV
jgi:hypothetical protein